jgi:hypothetical protein
MKDNLEITLDDFILEYPNFVSTEYCEEVINYFNKMKHAGFSFDRKSYGRKPHVVSDSAVILHDSEAIKFVGTGELNRVFTEAFFRDAYTKYIDKYSIIDNFPEHSIYFNKVQKSVVGEGYHMWHCENSSRETSTRILTYILYLNDVVEGGETEFLYYPRRVKARARKLVLFPGGFTHTHRGNPPLSNDKYVITGWVEL